jgi:hypothetical protein
MKKVDEYLGSIRTMLPVAERDVILAELREEITSQVEEQGEEKVDAILAKFGHPMVVAGRYQAGKGTVTFGRELIGKELYPFYIRTLKVTLGISSVLFVLIVSVVRTFVGMSDGDAVGAFFLHVGIQFLVLTGVFSGIQWQVSVRPAEKVGLSESSKARNRVRFEAVAELIVLAMLLPWMQAILGPTTIPLAGVLLSPVWHDAYWLVMGATLVTMVVSGLVAIRPDMQRWRQGVRVAATVVGIGTLAYLVSHGPWLIVEPTSALKPEDRANLASINTYVFGWGISITIGAMVIGLVVDTIKLVKGIR